MASKDKDYIDYRIIKIPRNLWLDFKTFCWRHRLSANKMLHHLIRQAVTVEQEREKEK